VPAGAVLSYILIAYALAWALSGVVWATGGHQSPVIGLAFATMLVPAVAAGIVGAVTNERVRIDWNRFPLRYFPVALLLMPVVMQTIILGQLMAAGPLPWQEWLTPGPDGLFHAPPSRGWGALTTQGLVFRIVTNAIVGVVIVSVLALFEEIGWRGWLQPRLADRFGHRLAIVVSAVIWAVWHVPFGLSGIHYIEGMRPIDVALGVPFGVIASGLIIGWLWARTESIWLVSIAHGAFNNWGQYSFKYMTEFATPDPGQVAGRAIMALYAIGVVLLIVAMPKSSTVVKNPS
jgi:membrane protease YdiL (CAAX protease family)